MLESLSRQMVCCHGFSHLAIFDSPLCMQPNDDGWGHTKAYAQGWDNIFGKKKQEDAAAEAVATAAAESSALLAKRRAALEAARACGALSDALFAQASKELE